MRLRYNPRARVMLASDQTYVINDNSKPLNQIFVEQKPLNLEIGVGKGNFLINSALSNPDQNYLGIEKAESILVYCLKKLHKQKTPLTNVKIASLDAAKLKEYLFNHCLTNIYLNFSDPWPKAAHAKRRLTSKTFLDIYHDLLIGEIGSLVLKTDNAQLFAYSIKSLAAHGWTIVELSEDLYNSEYLLNNIATEYEEKFVNNNITIKYLKARPKSEIA